MKVTVKQANVKRRAIGWCDGILSQWRDVSISQSSTEVLYHQKIFSNNVMYFVFNSYH